MKIEFKVKSRYAGSNVIKGVFFNKTSGVVNTLFKDGSILPRQPYDIEERDGTIYNHTLKMRIPHPTLQGMHLYEETFSFLCNGEENTITNEHERQKNALIASFYKFLKMHDHVCVLDEQGNDTNVNNIHSQFELIDLTSLNKSEAEKNALIIKAGETIKNLYDSNINAFRDFCYAYGIPMVDTLPNTTLFNMCMQKITTNPKFFFSIYDNKQRDIITLIELGLNKNIGTASLPQTALTITGESYYMQGDLLAVGRQALQEVLLTDVARRRILETLVGYTVTTHKSLEEQQVGDMDFTHLEPPSKKELNAKLYNEKDEQKRIHAKCLLLSRVKTKEDFEKAVEDIKEYIYSRPEQIHSFGLSCIDDYIKRNHLYKKFDYTLKLEDNLTKLGKVDKFAE